MMLGPIHRFLMDLGAEDEYGLYELLYRDDLAPPELRAASEPRELLTGVLEELLEAGLIYIAVRPTQADNGVLVARDEARRRIREHGAWEDPTPSSAIVVFGATSLTEQLLGGRN